MPDTAADRIRTRLLPLEPITIELRDDSASHVGHTGAASGGGHFELRLVSAQFAGLSKIERHRLVYHLLGDLMQREIHALAMNLRLLMRSNGRLFPVQPTPTLPKSLFRTLASYGT